MNKNVKYYYHVTSIKNLERIKVKGLSNNGDAIFLLDTDELFVVQHISFNQIAYREVAVLRINASGISGKIYHDNVGEMISKHQYYTKQNNIKPEFIEVISEYKFNDEDYIEFEVKRFKFFGVKMSKNQVRAMLKIKEE
jgi:hypothetical protein